MVFPPYVIIPSSIQLRVVPSWPLFPFIHQSIKYDVHTCTDHTAIRHLQYSLAKSDSFLAPPAGSALCRSAFAQSEKQEKEQKVQIKLWLHFPAGRKLSCKYTRKLCFRSKYDITGYSKQCHLSSLPHCRAAFQQCGSVCIDVQIQFVYLLLSEVKVQMSCETPACLSACVVHCLIGCVIPHPRAVFMTEGAPAGADVV